MGNLITYRGFEGGLYPGGSNLIPSAHADFQPPIDKINWYALVSLSMSNGNQEWCEPGRGSVGPQNCTTWSFVGQADADATLHDNLVLVNGAQSGMDAKFWESPSDSTYDELDLRLADFSLTPADVRIMWVKQVNAEPSSSLPSADADAFNLLSRLGNLLRAAKTRYPNLAQVYLSSRIWSCAEGGLNGEPHAYEGAFAVKWLIEAQIEQLTTGNVDPVTGDLGLDVTPWLAWGPYLWADGHNLRSDGLSWSEEELAGDCIHPSRLGEEKVGALLLDFFKHSELTADWFLK
jgi:hypothetical protein